MGSSGNELSACIYPGSFDPITSGHLDIIQRALKLFDKVVVCVATDPTKKPLFTEAERSEMIVNSVPSRVSVEVVHGLIVDYCKVMGINAIIRGLRGATDWEHEFTMSLMNRRLNPDVEMIYLMTDAKWLHISSSGIKSVVRSGGDIKGLVPEGVERQLKLKLYQ